MYANIFPPSMYTGGFPGGAEVKASACNVEDLGFISGLGRSPGEGNGNPLQYSCLGNPMDRGTWQSIVHDVTESDMTLQLNHSYSYFLKKITKNRVL